MQHFIKVDFDNFKAFKKFRLDLRAFNILVGPNNAGKSTIIAAFRILAAGIRSARAKSGQLIPGSGRQQIGYRIDLSTLSVAGENVFYNYDDSQPATVKFSLSDDFSFTLYFPESETCYLVPDALGASYRAPSSFRRLFSATVGFVPVLGPVEHDEQLYNPEAARRALFNYRAARNFRNIWHHFPEPFSDFQQAIQTTWPGMDVSLPEVERVDGKALLKMYCPEDRIDREIVWSGFGFQVWCQMLTHLIQSKRSSIFLIDEPDIYLHSDLQRQLVGLLRDLGPDIVIATHSTEIVTEAEPDELVLINKKKNRSKRIRNQEEIGSVFNDLGSNVNPILTQLAKTKKAVFVEGLDFQILAQFARKLGVNKVANRSNFAVIPLNGFNPERAKNLKEGIELTLGSSIKAIAILDRDYRSQREINAVKASASKFLDNLFIHEKKEIENFLLVPQAIDSAVKKRIEDRRSRGKKTNPEPNDAASLLEQFAAEQKTYIQSRIIALNQRFERSAGSDKHPDTIMQNAITEFDTRWNDLSKRRDMLPGKDALSFLNKVFQAQAKISVTPSSIVSAMKTADIPVEIRKLIDGISTFSGN